MDDCQAGFRAGRSTAEQVTNLRILREKYIEHGSKVFLNFVDYRKAFDRVWHDAIWAVLRKYGIDEDIMRALEQLNTKSTSKAWVGAKFSDKFPRSVGLRQGCVLSQSLFNVFLQEIGSRKVEELTGGVCVQGLLVNNLRFADDIALITNNSNALQDLTNRLNTESTRFRMEISAEKSKTLVVGVTPETLTTPVTLFGKQLEQVKQFKYLGRRMPDSGRSTNEVKIRAAMAMSSLVKMDKLWKGQTISLRSEIEIIMIDCDFCFTLRMRIPDIQ